MPIVRNTTKDNLIIFNKILDPNGTANITTDQLDEINHLVENKVLKVEVSTIKRAEIKNTELDEETKMKYLDLKERLIPALFALQFNQQITDIQLEDLIWFYKNIGPTSNIDEETKSLLDDINSDEELIEVLLNHLYPKLIEDHFKNKGL